MSVRSWMPFAVPYPNAHAQAYWRREASATSATADGLAPEGASQTKKFCLQVIKKRPRKPDVADVHEWCSAATAQSKMSAISRRTMENI
ncbi:hypothetical protein EVAR_25227_1 [Eumeta japonica]|uniref:Uncharacterized protein n=1 Tax=Eumeta variegata TaxID=151549 RepID=A0A4C1WI34_EUMVA|nr:hypothetical protein EVAR_25227_1 [Eumeta japonica]